MPGTGSLIEDPGPQLPFMAVDVPAQTQPHTKAVGLPNFAESWEAGCEAPDSVTELR